MLHCDGEYSPEQQAEPPAKGQVGRAVCARYSAWVLRLFLWPAAPAKARGREVRANRGGTAYFIALCQISDLAGGVVFCSLPPCKEETFYADL